MNSTITLVAISVAMGAGIALQALINSRLQQTVGHPLWAALISFIVGTLFLAALLAVARPPLALGQAVSAAPWWAWTGGFLGASFIAMMIVLIPRMSPALIFGASVFGQMALLIFVDHFGFFGVRVHAVTAGRAAGMLLLAVGAALCRA